jgi:hypothetical protein
MADPWTIKDTLFAVGSVIGSASGLGSAVWHVLNLRKERLDLRVDADIAQALHDGPLSVALGQSAIVVRFSIVNNGRREIYVEALGGTTSAGADFQMGDGFRQLPAPRELPCPLKDGQSVKVNCQLQLLAGGRLSSEVEVVALYAVDGRGTRWHLPRRQFLKVRTAARALLAKAEARSGMREIAAENRAERVAKS